MGTSAGFGNPKRSDAYRRIARHRNGFGVFGWVVLGLVDDGCCGLCVRIVCGFRVGDPYALLLSVRVSPIEEDPAGGPQDGNKPSKGPP